MVRIAVFDSGFGSLSIIKPIKKILKAEIIYFADQKNFPYGKKPISELKKIINKTIVILEKKFNPDIIIIGSNTPSILLHDIQHNTKIIRVLPPLKEALQKTKSSSIAILATQNVTKSDTLTSLIQKNLSKKIKVLKINTSPLIQLVEDGHFITKKQYCKNKINSILSEPLLENNVDVATLSSTHLPFLLPILQKLFPQISFLDPGEKIAEQLSLKTKKLSHQKNSLKIFTSGNASKFQKQLFALGIKNKVKHLTIV